MSDDPFEDIDPDDYRDREGDPFDAFDGDDDPEERDDSEDPDEHESEADPSGDPFEYLSGGPSADPDAGPATSSGDEDDRAAARGEQSVDVSGDAFGDVDVSRGDPFESADSPFRQVDVESVDPDEVWERFTDDGANTASERESPLGGEDVPEDAADVVEVPKGRFCQTCPHFSAPPDTACSHPGTELLTFVGTDEVRVSNCPVVRERRELGETYD